MFSILDSPSMPLGQSNIISITMYIFYGAVSVIFFTSYFIVEFWVRKNWSTFFKPILVEKL